MDRSYREVRLVQAQELVSGDVFSVAGSSWQVAADVRTSEDKTHVVGRCGASAAPSRHALSAIELVRIQVLA